jgi:hypothetical protein
MELNPSSAEVHHNLGNVYREQCRPQDAIPYLRRALSLSPNFPGALHSLGGTYMDLCEYDQAAECFDRALRLKPDFAEGHESRATLKLLRGEFAGGWSEYEARLAQLPPHYFGRPQWDGRSQKQDAVLLRVEQGIGDIFQFIRYAPVVKQRAGSVCVECDKNLIPILRTCPGIDAFTEPGNELPRFDAYAALLSLPHILDTRIETIPKNVPYLFADLTLVKKWRVKLDGVHGFRIGINWRGRGGRGTYRLRDIPPECFRIVASVPGVRLIRLQKGATHDELTALASNASIFDPGEDIDEAHGTFMDTAAIMMNLDLVITSDTAMAHLAGALGVNVWTVIPFSPNWRWLLDRDDCPWYPTMRLFRQRTSGDWAGVFEEMGAALRERMR